MPVQCTCLTCGKTFLRKQCLVKERNYCSKTCARHLYPVIVCPRCERQGRRTKGSNGVCGECFFFDRFWQRVVKTETCWIRRGAPSETKYTQISIKGRLVSAHRVAWEQASGDVLTPDDVIGHTCDNPPCVRNDGSGTYKVDGVVYPRIGHLWKATGTAPNTADKMEKGRHVIPWGDRHGSRTMPDRVLFGEQKVQSRLTDAIVVEIRTRYAAGDGDQYTLAAEYGVARSTIQHVINRKTWRHIP